LIQFREKIHVKFVLEITNSFPWIIIMGILISKVVILFFFFVQILLILSAMIASKLDLEFGGMIPTSTATAIHSTGANVKFALGVFVTHFVFAVHIYFIG